MGVGDGVAGAVGAGVGDGVAVAVGAGVGDGVFTATTTAAPLLRTVTAPACTAVSAVSAAAEVRNTTRKRMLPHSAVTSKMSSFATPLLIKESLNESAASSRSTELQSPSATNGSVVGVGVGTGVGAGVTMVAVQRGV